jgi:serine/threonine protein kinase
MSEFEVDLEQADAETPAPDDAPPRDVGGEHRSAGGAPVTAPAASPTPEPNAQPAIAGKYQLLARLGQGGMADVFLAVARGPLGFNKLVVLKRLRANDEDDQALQMFLDEARLAARLKHPNIVDTYDVGQEVESYFIAMEYLEGQPLSRVLKAISNSGVRVNPTIWVHVAAEALHGLHHAHGLNDYDGQPLRIVHRDVSPHNIFVTYEAEIKVVDFGIAKTSLSVAHTEAGLLRGKLGYMAPEQALRESVDRRADIFAMGVVLWEALTGRKVFDGDMSTMFAKLVQADIPKLLEVNPSLDPKLAGIVERALRKEPDDRFSTAAEMRDALLEYARTTVGAASKSEVAAMMATLFGEHRAHIKREIEKQLAVVARTRPQEGGAWDPAKILVPYESVAPPAGGDTRQPSSAPIASGSLSSAYTAASDRDSVTPPGRPLNRGLVAVFAMIAVIAGGSSLLVLRYAHNAPAPSSTLAELTRDVPVAVVPLEKPTSVEPAPKSPSQSRHFNPPQQPARSTNTPAPPPVATPVEQSGAIVRAFPTDSPPPPDSNRARRHTMLPMPAAIEAQAATDRPATDRPIAAAPAPAVAASAPAPKPGTIEPARLNAAIRAHRDEIQGCLDRARSEHPDWQGKVVVQSTIGPDGRVLAASASNTMEGGARLQACVLSAWREWTFPAPAGGVSGNVTKVFIFE